MLLLSPFFLQKNQSSERLNSLPPNHTGAGVGLDLRHCLQSWGCQPEGTWEINPQLSASPPGGERAREELAGAGTRWEVQGEEAIRTGLRPEGGHQGDRE